MDGEIQKTKAYYDRNAKKWSDIKTNSFFHEKEFVRLLKHLPKQNGSVIDIGCAGGIHVPLFLGLGRHLTYHGIDISDSFLKIAKRRYPQLMFTKGDISKWNTLPKKKKKFSGFFAAAVLMHIPLRKWDQMFSNIERLCVPRSVGYIVLPQKLPGSDVERKDDARHFEIFPPRAQEKQLESRGWKILSKGKKDGYHHKGVWRWYIVQLPRK